MTFKRTNIFTEKETTSGQNRADFPANTADTICTPCIRYLFTKEKILKDTTESTSINMPAEEIYGIYSVTTEDRNEHRILTMKKCRLQKWHFSIVLYSYCEAQKRDLFTKFYLKYSTPFLKILW